MFKRVMMYRNRCLSRLMPPGLTVPQSGQTCAQSSDVPDFDTVASLGMFSRSLKPGICMYSLCTGKINATKVVVLRKVKVRQVKFSKKNV